MTTRVIVVNEGPDDVVVTDTYGATSTIKPNQTTSRYVHQQCSVTVSEVEKENN